MTGLDDLIRLCPPPADVPAVDWPAVETTLGTRLPGDYKHLASAYGPGAFCDFLHVHHPHAPAPWANLTGPVPAALRDQLTRDRDQDRFPVPHDPQALFAIGVTDNGNHLFWVATPRTAPDAWRITVNEARGRTWHTFDGTLTGFLTAVLGGQAQVPVFPRDLLDGGASFTPSPARTASAPAPWPGRGRRIDSQAVRAWARANGYDIPERGRIPATILQTWEEAHPG
ncbi:histone-like nucleoid-structuring protein Lsr2 [Streptomyces fenghuangensis]